MQIYVHEATEDSISVVNIEYPEFRHTFREIRVEPEGVTAVHSVEISEQEVGKYNGDDQEQFLEDQGTEILNELIKIIDRQSQVA
ncbi:hypothetical protein CPT_Mendera_036 [Stenotrophomonas phage Mendera]|uniref:Uncharacterized protein n=1 Tax=Stenotrophomonas phage Mendera TaxID=2650877 RepID=A0A5P8PIW2_9CAUD|nr:hypothetical protein HWC60_gp036 [Stenotrophomonas phage Mendera]QFR56585.1 hypothetical protein CPT_Mendera_036 [Stenotrophomonas phage Mendera]